MMDNKLPFATIDRSLYDKSNQIEYSSVMKKEKKIADIETLLLQKVYLIQNYERYKFSLDLVKYLMNQAEILISKKDGVNKKTVVVSIMQKIFNLNTQESELSDHFVEFIWENKLIIKNSVFNCLKKRFLKMVKIVKHIPILTITQQVIKYTPIYKTEVAVALKVLIKLGVQYKLALVILAFIL